jgi:hypothetical protein
MAGVSGEEFDRRVSVLVAKGSVQLCQAAQDWL